MELRDTPDQHHVRLGQSRLRLAVVVRQHIVHRVDAAEIVGVQRVLPARARGGLLADIVLQQVHHRIEHVHHRDIQPPAGGLQLAAQRPIDQGGQHRPRLVLDTLEHAMQLEAGPDQAPAMIDDVRMLELHRGGSGDGVQRLAGGVGDQVQIDAVIGHGS